MKQIKISKEKKIRGHLILFSLRMIVSSDGEGDVTLMKQIKIPKEKNI